MKKYKKWCITIGLVLILCVIGYIYWFAIPKHTANKAVDNYLAAQKINSTQVKTRDIQKDWTRGGYYVTIVFKDDPNLVYEYNYNSKRNTPYHINLLVFKDGSSQEDDQVKHPPLQEQKD
ncbi:TPA: DUF3139 domain-containing protein [Listeria innocua]|nr:DUF3139 domain-containing protein [Listeria innocua]HBM3985546.1 DUF3139 domain-containing protein [Listeria innocua]HDA9566581.1 DUF3139 domain-containing protein [Listeria innocua]HDT2072269.1 DUF3139 domain-containing protein [Listeria innocua]HDT2098983.1 DUF3139 domain-containing protein [Listeria innocua]